MRLIRKLFKNKKLPDKQDSIPEFNDIEMEYNKLKTAQKIVNVFGEAIVRASVWSSSILNPLGMPNRRIADVGPVEPAVNIDGCII